MRIILKNSARRAVTGVLAVALATAGFSAPAYAQFGGVIYCTNCASVYSQAMQYAQELQTAMTTAQQLQTQFQQYQNQLTQGMTLPSQMVGQVGNDIQSLQSIWNQSSALSGTVANFDSNFRTLFPSYSNYATSQGTQPLATYTQQWNDNGLAAAKSAMEAAGTNVSSLSSDSNMINSLVQQSQSAQGQMQAIQAASQISAMEVQQLMKLRDLMNTMIQSQANWQAQQAQRQGVMDANNQANTVFFSTPISDSTSGQSFGGSSDPALNHN